MPAQDVPVQGKTAQGKASPASVSQESVSQERATQGEISQQTITQKTDEELTALTASWGDLSASERRTLLREVRRRMHATAEARVNANYARRARGANGPSGIVVQRRYGRKSDGVVVVQTRVIQPRVVQQGSTERAVATRPGPDTGVRPGVPSGMEGRTATGRITFGFGFERRARRQAPEVPAVSTNPISVDVPTDMLPGSTRLDQ